MLDASDSDDMLMERAGRGDRAAASMLIERHSASVLALCRRMLADAAAEDAAQETFLKLWRHAGRWRAQGASLEGWLRRVAANACLDRLRRRRFEVGEDRAADIADDSVSAEGQLIVRERTAAIRAALGRLPDRQRLAVVLCHFQELSNIEAAQIMETSVEAVESLLARARRGLKADLAALGAEGLEEGP